jgi:hypothetical protein
MPLGSWQKGVGMFERTLQDGTIALYQAIGGKGMDT